MYRIEIDRSLCNGMASCVKVAPDTSISTAKGSRSSPAKPVKGRSKRPSAALSRRSPSSTGPTALGRLG